MLLAIGDDRRTGGLAASDRVLDSFVLKGLELVPGDLGGVVVGTRLCNRDGRGGEPAGSVGDTRVGSLGSYDPVILLFVRPEEPAVDLGARDYRMRGCAEIHCLDGDAREADPRSVCQPSGVTAARSPAFGPPRR